MFLTSNYFTMVDEFLRKIGQHALRHLLCVALASLLRLVGVETDSLDGESETVRPSSGVIVILDADVDVADAKFDSAEKSGDESKQGRLRKLTYLLLFCLPIGFPGGRVHILLGELGLVASPLLLPLPFCC